MIENNQNEQHLVYELASQAYVQGEYEKAAAYFRFVILFNPSSFANWLGLASCLFMRGVHGTSNTEKVRIEVLEEALQAAKIAAELCPEDAQSLLLQLEIKLMQNSFQAAELHLLVKKAEALVEQNSLLQKELELIKIKVKRKTSSVFDLHREKI